MKEKDNVKIYRLSKDIKLTRNFLKAINDLLEILSPGKGKRIDSAKLKNLIRHPHFDTYLLEINGQIAGMGNLFHVETFGKRMAWVEEVVVHTNHQGKGLGTKIMKHMIKEAKRRGVHHLELTSNPKRVAANKLYKKLNFEQRKTNVYQLKLKKK